MEEQLKQMSYIQALFIGLLLGAFYYFTFFKPVNYERNIQFVEEEISAIKLEVAESDKRLREKEEIVYNSKSINRVLSQAKSLKGQAKISDRVNRIILSARDLGLSIESLEEPQNSWEAVGPLMTSNLNLSFKGSFSKIMYFMSALTQKESVSGLQSFSLEESQAEQEGAASDEVTLSASIELFKLAEPPRDEVDQGEI